MASFTLQLEALLVHRVLAAPSIFVEGTQHLQVVPMVAVSTSSLEPVLLVMEKFTSTRDQSFLSLMLLAQHPSPPLSV